jgi:uncharacterized Tic20 family protein
MIKVTTFTYPPNDYEAEKASNSYLMSLIALMVGFPLPIINLLATLLFYLNNRKALPYVKWHCTQALLSQLLIVVINSIAFSWTMAIIFGKPSISDAYIAYLLTIFIFNVSEFLVTIYTAIETRKGKHVEWWLFGPITNLIIKK